MRNNLANSLISLIALSVAMASSQIMAAESVYKCMKDGKISYSSNPSVKDGQCQQTVIRNDGPNPEELARILAQKRLRQEEERKAKEIAQKEREIRAKEIQAAAADRRARAIEEELIRLKQTPPTPPVVVGYPYYNPYWVQMPGPDTPHHHHRDYYRNQQPGYEVPGQPMQTQPQPLSTGPNRSMPIR